MKLHDKIIIEAPAVNIWPILLEPEFLPEWNDKIVAVKPIGSSQAILHAQFHFTFRMSKKETDCTGTLTALEYPHHITWRFDSLDSKNPWSVIDDAELREESGHTQLKRTVDLSKAPIPLIFRPLVWLILTFGRPTGVTNVEKIKALAEE